MTETLEHSVTRVQVPLAGGLTFLGSRPAPGEPEPSRRHLRRLSAGLSDLAGAAIAACCMDLLLFGRVAPLSGLIGFVAVGYVLFVVFYAVLISLHEDDLAVRDKLVTVLLWSTAVLMSVALAFILAYTILRGLGALVHPNFFTHDLSRAGSLAPLTVGGIKHALIGTLWMISIAMLISVPLGLVAAVFLNEVGGPFARFVRTIVEAMTALPSIVAGLFIFAAWILLLHREKSGLAAALALSVDMLPIVIRAADVVIRLVPANLREASAALGAPQWRSTWHVVLPTARSGLATAVILGMARGLGETAPVLLTAGYTTGTNTSPLHGPMVSLPLAAFELVKTGIKAQQARGYGAAALLLLLVLFLFIVARVIGGRGPGTLSKGQIRRSQRASVRDANRMIRRYDEEHGAGHTAPDWKGGSR